MNPFLMQSTLAIAIVSLTSCNADVSTAGDTPIADVTVVATDFALDAPDTLSAGLIRWTLENRGAVPHHLVVLKIGLGHSYGELKATVDRREPLPDWVTSHGGPEGSTNVSDSITVTARLAPGEYALLCVLRAGADTFHHHIGMIRRLVIIPTEAPTLPDPVATDTIRMVDFAFGLPDTLVAGRVTLRIENHGTQRHHAAIAQLPDGMSFEEFVAAAPTWADDEWPLIDRGGFTSLAAGQHAWYETVLPPGTYVLECLIVDPRTGDFHVDLGMTRELTVTPAPTDP